MCSSFFSVFLSASSITLNRDCGHSAFWVNLNEKICMEMVLIAEHFHAYPLEWHSDTAHSVCSKGLLLLRIFVSGKNKIFVSGQFSEPNVAYTKLNWTDNNCSFIALHSYHFISKWICVFFWHFQCLLLILLWILLCFDYFHFTYNIWLILFFCVHAKCCPMQFSSLSLCVCMTN